MGEEAFSGGTVLLQNCQRGPRASFSSFPRAFVLTESLSPLAQAVFGMTTLQRYNAPKIFSGSIFFFSQNGPACSSLIHSPSCLEAMLSFPCILPMQADKKKRDSHVPSFIQRYPLRAASPPAVLGRKERGLGMGKGTLSPGFLSHPKT